MILAALIFAFAIGWYARGQYEEGRQYRVRFVADDKHDTDWAGVK